MIAIALTFALLASACAGGGTENGAPQNENATNKEPILVSIPTGNASGLAYSLTSGVANVINSHVQGVSANAEVSAGSVENLKRLESGEVKLAYADSSVAHSYLNGEQPFDEASANVRFFAFISPAPSQVISPMDKPLQSLKDLAGKRVGIGGPGAPQLTLNEKLLTELGIWNEVDGQLLTIPDTSNALQTGQIDAIIQPSIGLPQVAWTETFTKIPISLYSWNDEEIQMTIELFPYMTEYTIPAGESYPGVEYEVKTVAGWNGYWIRADFPEEEAYEMAKAYFEHPDELTSAHRVLSTATLENTLSVLKQKEAIPALHPGVEKYLREKGHLK